MRSSIQGWMVIVVLGATMVCAVAEDFNLTTYYPSPRGVYLALRVGSGTVTTPTAHLHVTQTDAIRFPLAFRVDNAAGMVPFPFVIDQTGKVGVGTTTPGYALDVNGVVQMTGLRLPGGSAGQALVSDGHGGVTWGVVPADISHGHGCNCASYDDTWTLKGYAIDDGYGNWTCRPPAVCNGGGG